MTLGKLSRLVLFLFALGTGMAWACNLPLTPLPPTPTPAAPLALAGSPSPTYPLALPSPTGVPGTPTPTRTPWALLPTFTLASGGASPGCDRAEAGYPSIDITIPDDTVLAPGESFVKVWRLRNAGTCTWTTDYAVVWIGGVRLGAPKEVPLNAVVPPGGSIDISIPMQAPAEPGKYKSYWKLRNAQGQFFGLGPTAQDAFWVQIVVAASTPTPTFTPTSTATSTVTPSPTTAAATSTPTPSPSPTPDTPTPTVTPSPTTSGS